MAHASKKIDGKRQVFFGCCIKICFINARSSFMIEVIQSETFKEWLSGLKDKRAAARIQMRIDRLALGNQGDVKPVREGLSEMRIDYGAGYRVYFMRRGLLIVVLLSGGDKRTQDADIERAIAIAKNWSDNV